MLQSEDEVNCWTYHGGYDGSDIYQSVEFTSMNDCRDLCLADSECVGVHTTHFDRLPRKCELAKSGTMTASRATSYFFGATKECFEENPGSDCADHWTDGANGRTRCYGYERMCDSKCPTWVRLMTSVCRKSCGFCSEEDEDEDEEDDDNEEQDSNEEEDKMEVTWARKKGQKGQGKKLARDLGLDAAKKECCKLGDKCGGISCKGKRKCDVMADISKTTEHMKYTIYVKDVAV